MRSFGLILFVLCCSGCQVGPSAIQQGQSAYYSGHFADAREHLARSIKKERHQRDVAKLELAMVELAAGNPAAAESLFRECRQVFDARDTWTATPTPRSLMTDDRDRPYDTAGYEDVMIRSLLAITSLMNDSGDAEAYAIQAQMCQTELVQNAEARGLENLGEIFQPLALSPYLRGVVRESTHHDYDDAQRAYELVSQWQPDFRPINEDILRATHGAHSPPGYGVVYVFAFVGKGPIRVEERAEATGSALLIADRIAAASTDLAIPPTLAPVPIPAINVPFAATHTVAVAVNEQAVGVTHRITDVGQLAARQVQAELPWVIARGVLRRASKKALVAGTVNLLAKDNQWLEFGGAMAGSIWEATEKADTRCWSLLPREIQVLRVELPRGSHQLTFSAVGPGTLPNHSTATLNVHDGKNSYVLVVAPDRAVQSVVVGQ